MIVGNCAAHGANLARTASRDSGGRSTLPCTALKPVRRRDRVCK
jgi:hypothetical protein